MILEAAAATHGDEPRIADLGEIIALLRWHPSPQMLRPTTAGRRPSPPAWPPRSFVGDPSARRPAHRRATDVIPLSVPPRPRRYPHRVLTKGLTNRASKGDNTRSKGLSRLDRPTSMSGSRRRCLAVGVAAEVKNKLSVVDVVGESVSLKKAGTTYKGLCPFHGEKTPSFVVTPGRDSWHCFGCGLGGDIFSFVMQRDSVTFPEALRTLAERAGVEIDERTKREDAHKARLRGVLDSAIAFYHAVLTNSAAGKTALEYLHGRGFTDATIETYQLGWAPGGWDQMTRALATKREVRPEELVEVGLASPRQTSRGGVYDKFRSRVHLPDPRPERARRRDGRAAARGRRAEVPELAGDPALRQEPDALSHRQGQGPDPQVGPGGHRRGLHGRADGPPGRLRQRRRQPRDRVDAGPGRPADPLCQPDRARLRRRPGGREGGHARGDRAGRADRAAPGRHVRGQARGRPRRAAPRRRGSRRRRARIAGGLGGSRRQGQAARRVPHRSSRRPLRPQDLVRPDRLRRGRDAGHPRDQRSASPRRGARRGPACLGRRGTGPAPGPRTAGAQPDRRRRVRRSGRPERRVADERRRDPVVARRAADRRHPAGDHAGRVGAAPAPPAPPR